MIATLRHRMAGWTMVLAACLAPAPSASRAQERDRPRANSNEVLVERFGMEGFRYLLDKSGIEPLLDADAVAADPKKTMIILLGPASIRNYLDERLVGAVAQGASLLVASDRPPPVDRQEEAFGVVLEPFGVLIRNELVRAAPEDCFLHRPNLSHYPYVRPMKPPRHPVFADIESNGNYAVATNGASVLNFMPDRFSLFSGAKLAWYPLSATLRNGQRCDRNEDCFAIGGQYGAGRALFLADHSVFVNLMILREDNANRYFTKNCIGWLQGEEGKEKTRCLFVEDGVVKTDFRLPVPATNWLDLALKAALVAEKHADRYVADLEERDFFNKLILMRFSQREIVRCTLIAVTVLLLYVGARRLLGGRIGPDPARTLITPELAFLIPHGNVLEQRFAGQLEAQNVYEAVRRLVRDFLAGLDAEPDALGKPPRLEIKADHKNAAGLRKRIVRLWDIAYGSAPIRIKPEEWSQIAEDLKEILEEADDGWWKFAPARTTSSACGVAIPQAR